MRNSENSTNAVFYENGLNNRSITAFQFFTRRLPVGGSLSMNLRHIQFFAVVSLFGMAEGCALVRFDPNFDKKIPSVPTIRQTETMAAGSSDGVPFPSSFPAAMNPAAAPLSDRFPLSTGNTGHSDGVPSPFPAAMNLYAAPLDVLATDPEPLKKLFTQLRMLPAKTEEESQHRREAAVLLREIAATQDESTLSYAVQITAARFLPDMVVSPPAVTTTPVVSTVTVTEPAVSVSSPVITAEPVVATIPAVLPAVPQVQHPAVTSLRANSVEPSEMSTPFIRDTSYRDTSVRDTFIRDTSNTDWEELAQETIESLKRKIAMSRSSDITADETRLRLLQLAVGNQREAVRAIPGTPEPVRNFWSNNVLGMAALLDEVKTPSWDDRVTAGQIHFTEAVRELRTLCPLRIRNMQFVTDWRRYGVYSPVPNEFGAAEVMNVYFEIDNLTIKESAVGFNSRASYSYEVFDINGKLVDKRDDFSPLEQTTKSRNAEICIHLPVSLPKMIAPGPYFVRVTLRDLNHPKLQQDAQQIEFRIKSLM